MKKDGGEKVNTTGFGPVISQFKSEPSFYEFLELLRIRDYVEKTLDDMYDGKIQLYPEDFETMCEKDDKLTDKLFAEYGRSMGILITYLKEKYVRL